MQFFHGHFGGNGAQGVNEFTFNEVFQLIGRHGFHTQRLCGGRNALGAGFNADVKFSHHVNAHTVAGNQRLLGSAANFKAQCIHGDDFVQHGQHHRAAVHNDFFATKTGADKWDFFAGTAIQTGQDEAEYKQRDEYDAGDGADGDQIHGFSFLLVNMPLGAVNSEGFERKRPSERVKNMGWNNRAVVFLIVIANF